MYSVNKLTHDEYGQVISIVRDVNGLYKTPFRAVMRVNVEQRLLKEAGIKKVRVLIDEQLLTIKGTEHWANEEYKSLPKCYRCAAILNGDLYNNQLCKNLFCSSVCADEDYVDRIELFNDEEDCDYR